MFQELTAEALAVLQESERGIYNLLVGPLGCVFG